MNSTNYAYTPGTEEAGMVFAFCRFTVGATGAVPTFPDNFTRASANLVSVARTAAGKYRFTFDSFFVPGFLAANQNSQMGSNTGAAPTLFVHAQTIGANGTLGTDAMGSGIVTADNTNNQDASGVSYIDVQFVAGTTGADVHQSDEVNVLFVLKTERP